MTNNDKQMAKNVKKRQNLTKTYQKTAKKVSKSRKKQKIKNSKKSKISKFKKMTKTFQKRQKNEKFQKFKMENSKIQKFQNSIIYKIKKKFLAGRILILFVLCVSFFLSLSLFFFFIFFLFVFFKNIIFVIIFIFDEIPLLFCVLQQYSRPFVFRADTLCCWSDGSVLSRLLLRNHYRVGTFIGVDFCVFSPFLFQLQSFRGLVFPHNCRVAFRPFVIIVQDRAFVPWLQ